METLKKIIKQANKLECRSLDRTDKALGLLYDNGYIDSLKNTCTVHYGVVITVEYTLESARVFISFKSSDTKITDIKIEKTQKEVKNERI